MKIKDLFKFFTKKDQAIIEHQSFRDYVKNNVLSIDQIFERASYSGSQSIIPNPAKNSYLVYKCIQILSDRISSIPLKFYNSSTNDEIDPLSNEASRFILQPGDYTLSEFLAKTIMFYALYGESFWVIVDSLGNTINSTKIPSRIDIVDPLAIKEDLTEYFELKGWMYSASYKTNDINRYLQKDKVIQIKNVNPYNMWRGLRAIDAIANELGVDVKSIQELIRFYDNFAIPGTILTAPSDSPITPEDMKHYVDQFNSKALGRNNRFNTVGFSGGITATTLGITQDKQQLIETKKFIRDLILATFNVPLTYAGYTEGINRATADAQERNFWQNGVSILYKIQETLNIKFLNKIDPSITCKFDYDSIDALKIDLTETTTAAMNLMKLGYSPNDLNKKFNWDLPETEIGKYNYKEFNLEIIGIDGKKIDVTEISSDDKEDVDESDGNSSDMYNVLSNAVVIKSFNKTQSSEERRYKKKLSTFFFTQRKKVLEILSKVDNSIEKIVLYKLMSQLGDLLTDENKRIEKETKPYYEAMVLAGQEHAFTILGIERDVILNTKIVNERVNLIKGVNDTVFKRIKEQIFEGVNSGETIDDIANRVRSVYNYSTATGAKLIARTETATVINAATEEEYRVNGVSRKEWVTAGDSKVRPNCSRAAAQGPIDIDGKFHHGLSYPSEPNCRCTIVPVIN